MSIKILIADDHQLFREGLINLLSDSSEIEVIAQAEDGKEAIIKAKKFNPDIVIMDIGMPVMNGVEATKILKKELPDIKVIAISMYSDKHFIKGMLEAGASGYLLKSCTYDQLIEAINAVYSGKKYLSNKITEVIIHDYLGKEEEIPNNDPKLSERESEILKLFAEGKTSREISELLFVSVKTVGTHKQHILEKLELKTTTDLVKYALKKGIISLE
ncbi:MAG: response regulator transcription factor [Bacteroidales bacterium]|jgi:DNA-binding NarL/FixJ family response regulator|nr:response regulator transcription factor [Bacteroidales bacterium]